MHPALMKEKHYATFFITIYCLPHFLSQPAENISTAGVVQLGSAGPWSRRVTGVKTLIGPRSLAPSHRRSSVSADPGVSSRAAQQK